MTDATGTRPPSLPRAMWSLYESVHAVVYFAPEHRQAQEAAGLKGGWMAYFASRSAPLGAVPPEVVAACFFNFAPAMVARAIPDAWGFASPEAVLLARYEAVERALARLLGEAAGGEATSEATALLRTALEACEPAGRPMFAANLALPWPDGTATTLWHATTLLREHRGDGHVAALQSAELSGCEALVMAARAGPASEEQLRRHRGWTEEDWARAIDRLTARGLLGASGEATSAGVRLHRDVEGLTDRLAAAPWEHLGAGRLATLRAALGRLAHAVVGAGIVPYPNPMGLPPPEFD